jgi:Ribonuclease G/E
MVLAPKRLTSADVERIWPEPAARARELRDVFGDEVQLLIATNKETGEEIKREYRKPAASSAKTV